MIYSPKAKYKLVSPSWKYISGELSYEEGVKLLNAEAQKYHEQMMAAFKKSRGETK